MPKPIKEFQTIGSSATQTLLEHLTKSLRRDRLLHYPSEHASPAEQRLKALIASLEAGNEVRLTQAEIPLTLNLPGAAYLYNPTTQTYKETEN